MHVKHPWFYLSSIALHQTVHVAGSLIHLYYELTFVTLATMNMQLHSYEISNF